MSAESALLAMARESDMLDVIIDRIDAFEAQYKVKPTLVRFNPRMANALSVLFVRRTDMPAEYAVAWPIGLDGVLLSPDSAVGDDCLHLVHVRFKILEVF